MKTPVALAISLAVACVAAPRAAAQGGLISGVVLDVQTPQGQAAANVPILMGTTTLARTGSGGMATVPYSPRSVVGTRHLVVGVTQSGQTRIALVPEGETVEECEDPQNQQNTCEELGILVWGQTRQLSLRFSTAYASGASSSAPGGFSVGPTLLRSRELGAFGIGAQFNAQVAPAFSGGSWILSGGLNRFGLTNYSVWAAQVQGGALFPLNSTVGLRALGGLVFDRQSGQFGSGTESGFTLNTGVVYALPMSGYAFSFVGEIGVSGRRNTQDVGFGFGFLSSW